MSRTRRSPRAWIGSGLVAVAWFATALAAYRFAPTFPAMAAVWPASGIAVGAMLILRRQALPGIFIGAWAFALYAGIGPGVAIVSAAGAVAEAALACWILRRLRVRSRMARTRDALGFAFGCALLAPLPAAVLGPVTLLHSTAFSPGVLLAAVSISWMAHTLGILALVPAILAWRVVPARSRPRKRDALRTSMLLLVHTTLSALVFSGVLIDWVGQATVAYLVLPVMVWIALSCGLRAVTASGLILVTMGTLALSHGTGPLMHPQSFGSHVLMFTFLSVALVTSLMVSALATERRISGLKLRRSLERFVALTSLSADAFWEEDSDGTLRLVAEYGTELQGSPNLDAMLPRTRAELSAEIIPEDRARHERAVAHRESFRDVRLARRARAGGQLHVSISGEPMFADDGSFTGYRGTARDITLQRRAEQEIAQSQRFLGALINAIPSPVLVKDSHHRYLAANRAFEAFFQRPPAEILGRDDHDFFSPEQAAYFVETDDRALAGDLDVTYEQPYLINGRTTWMAVQKRGLTAPDGTRVLVLLLNDVTARRDAEERLKASEQRFRSLTELSADWYWEQDAEFRFTYVSPTAVGNIIVGLDEVIGRTRFDADFEWESDAVKAAHRRTLENREPFRDLVLRARSSGHWGLTSGEPVFGADGRFLGYRGVGRDITKLKQVERQLRESEARFRDFAEAASEFVWESDAQGRYTFLSSKVRDVLGYTSDELVGRTPQDLMPPGEAERALRWLEDNTREDGSYREFEHRWLTRAGTTVWVTVNAVAIHDDDGAVVGHRGTVRDVTDRKQAEERISQLATRDPLTGLPNRLLLHDRLDQGLLNARRSRQALALMFLDLDRFKNINDSLGHDVGDLLLKEVASRMQGCLRKGDTLSRLGGDEFVVTVEGLQHAEDAAQVARKILTALARPMEIAGHTLTTSCSIGISIYPSDADDVPTLMKNADTAMYHAKEKGRRNYQFFSREMNIRAVERHDLETALRLALDRDEFVLYYQPQVDIASGRLAGVEALLRWRHPKKGIVLPSTFIEVAEETGLIEAIGLWVLRNACEQCKAWQDRGYPAVRVAVNVSARQFTHPTEFARNVQRTLARTGLDPTCLELEMTESVIWRTADDSVQAFRRLGKLGTRLAVDDFGTGYSSLSNLKQLPIDTLKIDRSFVRDVDSDKDSDVIIATIIGMAHSLDLRVTAEGVENLGQLSALKRLGCDEYQGFLFNKPVPAEELARRYLAPRQLNFGA
ncbi:MAG: EAL domain-containing protein [Betaproteobacteria bacterium]|nr:EAL domain-containing protein [Betaproteobacteria bacterium]